MIFGHDNRDNIPIVVQKTPTEDTWHEEALYLAAHAGRPIYDGNHWYVRGAGTDGRTSGKIWHPAERRLVASPVYTPRTGSWISTLPGAYNSTS